MHRRDNLAHLIIAGVIVFGLTLLMVCVDAQAQIAFASSRDGNYEIYVMDADGGNPQNLTNNPHGDSAPSWSPDGKRIVFMSNRDGHAIGGLPTDEIYVMDADGSNPQNLTNNPHYEGAPSWSPDGERIAFSARRDGHFENEIALTYEIYVMDADGGNEQRLTENRKNDDTPSWSPDGKRIAFASDRKGDLQNYEIYVMDTNGGNPRRLTNNRNDDRSPSWSPDGKRIVFSSNRNGNWKIYVMDINGGNPRRLTNNRHDHLSPSWSPDGKRIVFTSDRDGHRDINAWLTDELYVMDADGGNQQRLTENPHEDWEPSWSPDGKRIAFVSDRDGNAEIYVMDANGRNQRRRTKNGSYDGSPAWYAPALAVAPAGKTLTIWGWLKQVDR